MQRTSAPGTTLAAPPTLPFQPGSCRAPPPVILVFCGEDARPECSLTKREGLLLRENSPNALTIGYLFHKGTFSPMIRTTLSALLALVRAVLMPRASLPLS